MLAVLCAALPSEIQLHTRTGHRLAGCAHRVSAAGASDPSDLPQCCSQCLVELFGLELTGGGRSSTAVLSLG